MNMVVLKFYQKDNMMITQEQKWLINNSLNIKKSKQRKLQKKHKERQKERQD